MVSGSSAIRSWSGAPAGGLLSGLQAFSGGFLSSRLLTMVICGVIPTGYRIPACNPGPLFPIDLRSRGRRKERRQPHHRARRPRVPHLRVDRRRADVLVVHQELDEPNVRALLEELGCERMSEAMRQAVRHAGGLPPSVRDARERLPGPRAPAREAEEEGPLVVLEGLETVVVQERIEVGVHRLDRRLAP